MNDSPLLAVKDLHAHYGKSHILHGVTFDVAENEVVSLLGRNGSGRSTTMKSIMGLVSPSRGSVCLNSREISQATTHHICRSGIAYVPEEREVFSNLSVDENLKMGVQPAPNGRAKWTIEEMFSYFPNLKKRRNTKAGSLSGGEQQMLTICRSLLGNPSLILIDEPTEGLAPKLVTAVGEFIQDIQSRGVSVILVEQKLAIALKVSSRVCVMGHGRIVFEGNPLQLTEDKQLLADWLAV